MSNVLDTTAAFISENISCCQIRRTQAPVNKDVVGSYAKRSEANPPNRGCAVQVRHDALCFCINGTPQRKCWRKRRKYFDCKGVNKYSFQLFSRLQLISESFALFRRWYAGTWKFFAGFNIYQWRNNTQFFSVNTREWYLLFLLLLKVILRRSSCHRVGLMLVELFKRHCNFISVIQCPSACWC